jgi:hypothetical protein
MRIIIFAALFVACSSCEKPKPPLPPADGDGTCETAKANLEQLGGCGLDLERYVLNCHDAEKEEAEHGVRHPNTCVTTAKSCQRAFECR